MPPLLFEMGLRMCLGCMPLVYVRSFLPPAIGLQHITSFSECWYWNSIAPLPRQTPPNSRLLFKCNDFLQNNRTFISIHICSSCRCTYKDRPDWDTCLSTHSKTHIFTIITGHVMMWNMACSLIIMMMCAVFKHVHSPALLFVSWIISI